MRIVAAARTDIGKVKDENEDAYGVYPDLGLFLVADGLGGHAGGEVASRLAIEEIHRAVGADPSPQAAWPAELADLPEGARRLVGGLLTANQAVLKTAADQPYLTGMGTTVVAAYIPQASGDKGETAYIAHVGDSRAYLIRQAAQDPKPQLLQLTEDHSVVNDYVAQGLMSREVAEGSPYKHILSRALGLEPTVHVDLRAVPLKVGDRLLLGSDGLTNMVPPDEILSAIVEALPGASASEAGCAAACEALIAGANGRGGEDNITAIVITVEAAGGGAGA